MSGGTTAGGGLGGTIEVGNRCRASQFTASRIIALHAYKRTQQGISMQ
jgi:hypothetical protein